MVRRKFFVSAFLIVCSLAQAANAAAEVSTKSTALCILPVVLAAPDPEGISEPITLLVSTVESIGAAKEVFSEWLRKAAQSYISLASEVFIDYSKGVKTIFIESLINAQRYGLAGNPENQVRVVLSRSESQITVAIDDESGNPFDPRDLSDPRNSKLRHRYRTEYPADFNEVMSEMNRVEANRREAGYVGRHIEEGRGVMIAEEQLDPDRKNRYVDTIDWQKVKVREVEGTRVIFTIDFNNWARLPRVPR